MAARLDPDDFLFPEEDWDVENDEFDEVNVETYQDWAEYERERLREAGVAPDNIPQWPRPRARAGRSILRGYTVWMERLRAQIAAARAVGRRYRGPRSFGA